jgi:hypothetical protein
MTSELANNRAARPRNNYSLLWVFENSRVQVMYNLYVHVPGNSSETRCLGTDCAGIDDCRYEATMKQIINTVQNRSDSYKFHNRMEFSQ